MKPKIFLLQRLKKEKMSKRLSKYFASFDCFDKPLIVLSVTSGSLSIASFTTVIGAPVGITSPRFSSAFSMTIGN